MTADDPIEDAYPRFEARHVARASDVWTLIGRLDYFLEVCDGLRAAERRRIAAQLRGEIKGLEVGSGQEPNQTTKGASGGS